MKEINTSNFTFSDQAKKLPEIIIIDTRFVYIIGLWKADKCSTAKGIVGIRNKNEKLLTYFKNFIEELGLQAKIREIKGYGITKEVYVCSMPLRRIFEYISEHRLEILNEDLIPSYFAGLIDGDGTIIRDKRKEILRIFYSKKEEKDIQIDKKLLEKIGVTSKITMCSTRNLMILTVREMRKFGELLLPFILTERKLQKLKLITQLNETIELG